MQNQVRVIGVDVAKNVFQIHGVDARGKMVFRKTVSRAKLVAFMADTSPCLVGMEACGGANHWGRKFRAMGHEVRLMAPQYVKPYVKTNKNDATDAEAIAEAVTRPGMRFVAVKEIWQQDILIVHRVRERLVKQRTALTNEIRGFLQEYGIVFQQGHSNLRNGLVELMASSENALTPMTRQLIMDLMKEWSDLDERLKVCEDKIRQLLRSNEMCKALDKLSGIGPITATALIATIGDPNVFKNGRQVSSYFGLVPRHEGSGGNVRLKGISKRGDKYIRRLLIHGARSMVRHADRKTDHTSRWITRIVMNRGFNKACVAMANKNARMCWAVMMKLSRGETVSAVYRGASEVFRRGGAKFVPQLN